jgi:hypothetical protein
MAKITARNVTVDIDDSTGACQSISGRTNSATLSFSAETPDVSAFGTTYRERVPDGLKDWELSVSGFWDGSSSQLDEILFGIHGGSTLVRYGPAGSTSGCTKYEACAVCSDYNIEAAVEGAVTYSATFSARTGSMTRTTWA